MFSATLKSISKLGDWKIWEILFNLNNVLFESDKFVKDISSKKISPLSISSIPANTFSNVDFPTPDGPEIDSEFPDPNSKDAPFITLLAL